MKLLIFTDTHNSETAERKIVEKAKKFKPDIMLCCGDFTVFMHMTSEFLRKINKLGIKTYILHGNHEDEEIIEEECKKYKNIIFLHEKTVKINNLLIIGYGGGGFALKDSRFKLIEPIFKKAIKNCQNCKKIVMLHQPPYKSGIDLVYGEYAGNKTTKDFIIKNDIDYVFAGHIHETAGLEYKTKKTKYINPGPFGKIIEIDDK
jgi:putative phosphoesterase